MDQDLVVFLNQHFAAIDQHFAAIDQHFAAIDQRFASLEQRVEERISALERRMDQRFEQVDQRLDGMEQRLDGMEQRLDRVEDSVNGAYILAEELQGTISLVAEGVDGLREQMERQEKRLLQKIEESDSFNRQAYEALEVRVSKLEAAKKVRIRKSGPRKT